MDDQDHPVTTAGAGSSDADQILQYAHDRYRRRKRIQRRALSAMTVLIVAIAAITVTARWQSPRETRSIRPSGPDSVRPLRLSCRNGSPAPTPRNAMRDALVSVTWYGPSSRVQRNRPGTGMIVSAGGEVLTSYDGVDRATGVTVRIGGTGPARAAHVVAVDPADDIVLLRIDNAANLRTVRVADPANVEVGDAVTASGTRGRITAIARTDLETSVPFQPRDVGGPLLNARGEVIGMIVGPSKTVHALPVQTLAGVIVRLCRGIE
jgi:S1-C subfamily serine protease